MNTLNRGNVPSVGVMQPGMSLTLPQSASGALPGASSRYNLAQLENTLQQQQQQQQRFFKDYFKKRSLLLYLISHELDHLYTFHNPFNLPNLVLERIETPINHLKVTQPEKQWVELVRMAWSTNPVLAIFLSLRFPLEFVVREVQSLVKSQPERVTHVQQACVYLATEQNISNDSNELNYLLIW